MYIFLYKLQFAKWESRPITTKFESQDVNKEPSLFQQNVLHHWRRLCEDMKPDCTILSSFRNNICRHVRHPWHMLDLNLPIPLHSITNLQTHLISPHSPYSKYWNIFLVVVVNSIKYKLSIQLMDAIWFFFFLRNLTINFRFV